MIIQRNATVNPNTGDQAKPVVEYAHLNLNREEHQRRFDREPFPFTHNLSGLDLFKVDSLRGLAEKFIASPRDYFIAASARSPEAMFYSVPNGGLNPRQAIDLLEKGRYRVLLKRPERYDQRFRDLLDTLFGQVVAFRGGLAGERVERLESAILISSGSTTTPVHFDPEVGFFSQIEGDKCYHVYPPDCTSEAELERFYVRGRVDVGNVDLTRLDRVREHVFHLEPGKGFHQPQNAAHWVRTGRSLSVSYTFVFETDKSRSVNRTRAFNYCLRNLGLDPSRPGSRPALDRAKAAAMRAARPIQLCGKIWNKTRRVVTGRRLSRS
jgi:hypothetical protein